MFIPGYITEPRRNWGMCVDTLINQSKIKKKQESMKNQSIKQSEARRDKWNTNKVFNQ